MPARIHVAHFLEMELAVGRLLEDVNMLKAISMNHGDMIRELLQLSANSATKAELMASVSVTRHQQLNVRLGPHTDEAESEGAKSLSKCHIIINDFLMTSRQNYK